MKMLTWWMRIVGSLYLLLFVAAAILKVPIQVLAPAGTLEQAASGNELARFVVDTWVILGLAICSVGIGLLFASHNAARATALVWTVMGFELIWGICSDIYQISRGHAIEKIIPWIVIHIVIITTGIYAVLKMKTDSVTNP